MKKTRTRRILSWVMCLFLLAGHISILSVLTMFSAYAAEDAVASGEKLKITLSWWDGTDPNSAATSIKEDGKTIVKAVIKVTGSSALKNQNATVKVSTIDLSARAVSSWAGQEYRQTSQTFTIACGSSATFAVEVYNMKKYNKNGTMDNVYPAIVSLNGMLMRHQVGIQIVEHSDNAYVSGNRTLRAYVNNPGNADYVLYTQKNTAIDYYPTAAGGLTKILHDSGYSYKGASENREVTSYDVKHGGGDWDNGRTNVSGDPGGSGYQLITSGDRKRAGFYFQAPYAVLRDSNNHRILLNHFSDLKVYISGNFRVHKQGGGDNNDPLAVKFGYDKDIDVTKNFDDHRDIGNNSYKDRKLIHWFPTGDSGILNLSKRWSSTAGANYSGWKQVSDNGERWVMWARNEDGQSGNNRVLFDLNMGVTIVKDKDPTVSEIYLSQSKTYAGAAEDLYLMVRLSEPVQLYPADGKKLSDFNVRTQVYNGGQSVGSTVVFNYVDGNYTDTLIFKANLTDEKAQELYGNQLRISEIEDDAIYAADLFIDGSGMNNKVDFSQTTSGGKVTGMMLDLDIDARVPEISWDSGTTIPDTPVRSFYAMVKVTNMANGGTFEYAWSTNRNIHTVTKWTSAKLVPLQTATVAEVKGNDLNGDMYLHVRVCSPAGVYAYRTFTLGDKRDTTIRFDNTPPKIEHVSGEGQYHNRYQDEHKIVLKLTDPQTSRPTESSKIEKVWYYVKSPDGNSVSTGPEPIQVYGSGGNGAMSYNSDQQQYTMTLTAEAAGVPQNQYGAYHVYFMAQDEAGNITTFEGAQELRQPVMFDRREKFLITYDALYDGVSVTNYADSIISPADGLGDYDIYYNERSTEGAERPSPLTLSIRSSVAGGAGDTYSLHTVERDGEFIYVRHEGGWQIEGGGEGEENGIKTLAHPAHGTVLQPRLDTEGYMITEIRFAETAAGRYDFVFARQDGLQSEILTVYITPRDAATPNYTAIYDPERLLVNQVWQFTTGQYFSGKLGKGVPYDGTIDGIKPIFSSYEKALEYARFTEIQDIELLYLDGSTDSNAIANYLNSGFNPTYMKAGGETVSAAAGQTWLRYKSRIWTPESGATAGNWVYYYYGDGNITEIRTDDFMDLSTVNVHLEEALQNNAEDIAGKNGGWVYLTKNASGNYTDSAGQPTYSRNAIFYDDIIIGPADGPFSAEMIFKGDTAIADSFIPYTIGTAPVSLPLIGNHTFTGGDYAMISYRPYTEAGDGEWIPLSKGDSLRALGKSGVYEFKELGGGYRRYYAYCDFDAPLLHYNFIMSGQTVDSTAPDQFFSQTFNGNVFQAKSLTLKYIFDPEHILEGAPVELDRYSYIYITRNVAGGMVEEAMAFYSREDLIRLDEEGIVNEEGLVVKNVTLPNGQYRLHVYDRLGNHYSLNINTNGSPLIATEPRLEPNTSVTFYINRDKNQIAEFSVTRQGISSEEVDTQYEKTKTYVKSGTYTLRVKDIFGNVEERTVTLERIPPTVSFYYKDGAGQFRQMTPIASDATTPQSAASVRQHDEAVYVISSSVDVRVAYDSYAKYKFSVEPDEYTDYSLSSGASTTYIELPVTEYRWTLTIYYANDEDAKVTITCINDSDPPQLTADATVPTFRFHELENYGNVLASATGGTRQISLASGSKAQAERVTFTWDDGDGSGVEIVSYTVDGGEEKKINPKNTSGFTVSTPGHYKIHVSDLLNNTTEFEVTVSDIPQASMTLADGTLIESEGDPLSHITGSGADAVFTKTDYTGQDFRILLSEELDVTLLRSANGSTQILKFRYRNGQMELQTLDGENGFTDMSLYLLEQAPSGDLNEPGFPVSYHHDKHGLLLTFPENQMDQEWFQIRITDPSESYLRIYQLERSNRLPKPIPVKAESRTPIGATDTAFTGINEGFTFTGDTADIISVTAYRADKFTMDFSGVSEKNTYHMLTAGIIGTVEDEGYFRVVITNKYGNSLVYLLRVNFGSNIEVLLQYREFEPLEHVLRGGGSYEFFSNDRVVVCVWDLQSQLSVRKDGALYNPPTRSDNGCVEMTFREIGTYAVEVTDEFGTEFAISLDVRAPEPLPYGNYLSGFNEQALMRDEQYTNAPLSLSGPELDNAGVAYVSYRREKEETWTVVYDTLSENRIDNSTGGFVDCIGQQNGTYTVRFVDRYGNVCLTDVHISDQTQLYVSRQTKNSAGNLDYKVASILESGVWSNYIVRLYNEAAEYRLTVDGREVRFEEDGSYILELALSKGDTAEEEHTVAYIDNYGNRYEFVVHLMRKTPVIRVLTDGEEVVRNNTVYVKGSFGFEWEDSTITAVYSKNKEGNLSYTAGHLLAEDGTYTFTFTDVAGNIESRRISRDTVVSFSLIHGNNTVASGIGLSGHIRIAEAGERMTITEILRNGEPYELDGQLFNEHGSYVVTLADEVGNTASVQFDIFNQPMQAFTYTTKGEYALYQVWYHIDGVRQPANGIMLGDDGHQEFTFWEDGFYEVDLLHVPTNTYVTYEVEIDNLAPEVALVGTDEDGTTRETVTLEGLSKGDTVEIWIDGKLSETIKISSSTESPAMREAGEYKVIIRDIAGNETVCTFRRAFTSNTASNILVCILLFGSGIGCALILHNRGRVRVK